MAIALVAGCAVGQKIPYNVGQPNLRPGAAVPLALAVQDERPEIVDGTKRPNFVGVFRGGFGNPFDATTASGESLAADFAETIGRGLGASGYRVLPVATRPAEGLDELTRVCARTAAPRWLLVQLAEWKSDTMMRTALIYDIRAQVMDAQGHVLGKSRLEGRDKLGGDSTNAKALVPDAHRAILERLLNDPAIVAALAPPTNAPAAGISAPPAVAPAATAAPAPPSTPAPTPAPEPVPVVVPARALNP